MTSKKNMSQNEFGIIKNLTKVEGLTNKLIAELRNRSPLTVSRVRAADSFQEYKAFVKSVNDKSQSPKESVPDELPEFDLAEPADDGFDNELQLKIERIAQRKPDHLERIANALERLADAWESQPAKKGLFK